MTQIPTTPKAIIFDFDGTLAELTIDFGEMKKRVARVAARYISPTPSPNGLPVLEWLEQLSAHLKPDQAKNLLIQAQETIVDMEVESAAKGRLFPYTKPMLRALVAQKIRVGIITRNCTQAVRTVFPDLDDFCPVLLTRDHVNRVKPDPSHLLRALEHMQCNPVQSLMVGDHPTDIQTGHRAGTLTAGVASGRMTRQELQSENPHFLADDCAQLMELLFA